MEWMEHPARSSHSARAWRSLARNLLISAAVGVAVTGFMALGRPDLLGPRSLVVGAVMGACIGLACSLLIRALHPVLDGLAAGWRRLAIATALFVGGIIGWCVAALIARVALGVRVIGSVGDLVRGLLIVGLIAIVVGSLFVLYEALRSRLERSIEAAKANEYAVRELELAAVLQSRLLPERRDSGRGWRTDVAHHPARWVAGDLYHVVRLPDGSVVAAVGDVAGKGMAASLVMASVTARLPLLLTDHSLPETFEELRRRLVEEGGVRHFVALALVRLDPASGAFELANAGLPDPYHLCADGSIVALSVPGPRLPLGVRAGSGYRVLRGVLAVGERLLLLSDGIPEATSPLGEPLGYAAFERLLGAATARGPEWLEHLVDEVRRRTGSEPEDDWTLMLLERTAVEPRDGGDPPGSEAGTVGVGGRLA